MKRIKISVSPLEMAMALGLLGPLCGLVEEEEKEGLSDEEIQVALDMGLKNEVQEYLGYVVMGERCE